MTRVRASISAWPTLYIAASLAARAALVLAEAAAGNEREARMNGGAQRVALVGAGRMGAIHGRHAAANPRFELAALVEPRAAEAAVLGGALGCPVMTLDAVLGDAS